MIKIRLDDKGEFDEIVAQNVSVHVETMDKDCIWLCVQKGESRVDLWIRSTKGRLSYYYEDETQ